jgi:hypothetical protein
MMRQAVPPSPSPVLGLAPEPGPAGGTLEQGELFELEHITSRAAA